MSGIDTEKLAKMRHAAPLLPEPGDEVVIELLDEIDRLRAENERLREQQDDNTDLLENLRKGQTTGQGSPKQQPPDRSRTQFAVFYDTRAELTPPWVVIYRTTNPNSSLNEGVWGRYQSNIVNEATAKEIADALQAAGVDPERA